MKPHNDSLTINWIQKWANYSPKAIALVEEEVGLSMNYSELARVVSYYAIKIKAIGLKSGDRLAVLSPNKIEFIYLFLASQQLGIILVPLNFRLTPSEVSWLIHDCEPTVWVLDSVFEEYVIDAGYTGKVILFH